MKRSGTAVLAILMAAAVSAQQSSQPKYQQNGAPAHGTVQKGSTTGTAQKGTVAPTQKPGRYSYSPQFSEAERDTIRTCMAGTYGNTGVTVRPLPAAADSQVQLNTSVSAALQRRLQPLPDLCASRLTMTLPANWSRGLLGRHVVLLDPNQKIVDMFDLN